MGSLVFPRQGSVHQKKKKGTKTHINVGSILKCNGKCLKQSLKTKNLKKIQVCH